ncbi:hypothetical protein KEM52_001569 [Ascosphaera acerosa]|nr:hypothetical protein KEM52_001569 [Ascosphaera acerosa]
MSMLPCLVGSPKAGDEVLGALPVCAPWSALAAYKHKVKIQPGPLKRGKAVKEMIGRFVAGAEAAVKAAHRVDKQPPIDGHAASRAEDAQDETAPDTAAQAHASLATIELDLLRAWKDTEGVNSVPVSSLRIVSGADSKGEKGKGSSKGGKGGKASKPTKGAKPAKGSKRK